MVLYRNQRPVNFILHFSDLQSGSWIRNKTALFENTFFKCYKVKSILIPFNCFCEYSFVQLMYNKNDHLAKQSIFVRCLMSSLASTAPYIP